MRFDRINLTNGTAAGSILAAGMKEGGWDMMESVEIVYRTKEDEHGGGDPLSWGRWKVVHHISPHKSWECCKQTYEEALIEAKETIEKYFQK